MCADVIGVPALGRFLQQDAVWPTANGTEISLASMTTAHQLSVLCMLEARRHELFDSVAGVTGLTVEAWFEGLPLVRRLRASVGVDSAPTLVSNNH